MARWGKEGLKGLRRLVGARDEEKNLTQGIDNDCQ
jgi:hypothetical protein